MADQEHETESGLTKVAKTVGSALGTVASKASGVIKTNSEDAPAAKAKAKSKASKATGKSSETNEFQQKALNRKKSKRLKHRRKLGQKTKG